MGHGGIAEVVAGVGRGSDGVSGVGRGGGVGVGRGSHGGSSVGSRSVGSHGSVSVGHRGSGVSYRGNGEGLLVDVSLSGNLDIDVSLSGDLSVHIGLGSDVLVDVSLSGDLLVHIGLGLNLGINVGLSCDVLMDVGLGKGVEVGIGDAGVVGSGVQSVGVGDRGMSNDGGSSGHRGGSVGSHGGGSGVAVAVASVGSGEGVASGQGVGCVPRGQDGGLRRDGGRKGKDGNLSFGKCEELKKMISKFLFWGSILTKDFIFSSAMLLLFECNCVALTVRSFYTWRACWRGLAWRRCLEEDRVVGGAQIQILQGRSPDHA